MDDITSTKSRTFMRGEVKNARAEELLALLKAERETIDDIEATEIPSTLKKRPLLPAIRRTSTDENSLYCETGNFPVTKIKSRFLWKDLDWEEKKGNRIENVNEPMNREYFRKQKEHWANPYENTARHLPPLKPKRKCSQNVVRPSCPEPPMTPCFDENSD